MSRRLKLWLAVAGCVVLLGGAFLWVLPEIVRRTVVTQIPKLTGRSASIGDIDLNLFTGRLVLKQLRLAERDPAETFIQADRVDLRVSPLSLVVGHLRLADLTLTAPRIRIVRTGPVEFNFSDLLALLPPADPAKPKSRWTVSMGRLALVGGAVLVSDRAVSPAREWQIEGITVEAGGLTTRAAQEPGHLDVRARVNEAPFDANAGSVLLTPAALTMHLSLERFDLTQVRPYLPPGLPASLESGTLGLALEVTLERGEVGIKRAVVSGEIRAEGLALAQPGQPVPFVKLPRLTVAIKEADLLSRSATLTSIEADGLDLRAVRDKAGNVDLLALVSGPTDTGGARIQQTPAAGPPSTPAPGAGSATPAAAPLKVTLERLTLRSGTIGVSDEAVSPAREWRLQGLTVEGAGLSTSSENAPGTLKILAQLNSTPGAPKAATISVDAGSVRLIPLEATARMVLEGLDLGALGPYWPATLPALAQAGSLGVTVDVGVELGDAGLSRASASGSARLQALTLVRRDQSAPFVTVPKLTVGLKQADMMARTVALGSIAIEGVDARAVRDAAGKIDLLELISAAPASAGAPAAAPPPPTAKPLKPPAPGAPAWRISLDRFDFTKGTATFEDRAVSPATTLALTDLKMTAERVTWPSTSPATFSASMAMPGGGRTEVKGRGKLDPLDVQITISTRDAPIAPYQAYFPFPARFVGFFSGDSLSEIQRAKDGKLILASRGQASARDFEVRPPDADTPVARLARLEIQGLDFSWPNYALVNRVTLTQPQAQVERDSSGTINLRRLFTAGEAKATPPPPVPDASAAGKPAEATPGAGPPAPSGGLMQELVIDFNEIAIEDGYIRFLDRTTTPPFSEDMSGFALTIRDLSNQMGRKRTSMTARAKVGGDAALEMQGQLSGIGEGLRADLTGELQEFALAAANPYADSLTSWIIERGKLSTRLHYRVEGDRLIADHDLKFAGLQVERSGATDEARRRIGLPLGLVVAMLKDSHGDIELAIPLRGTLSDRKFDWREAMWASARQAIVKLVVSPFSAIGRAFTSGDDKVEKLEVDPVTFSAASSVIAPPMELHLTRVADFLRRAPYIKLKLAPAGSAADVETLKAQEISARLQRLQREQGLRDQADTLRAYYMQQAPDMTLPKTVDEQLALLRSREPVPAGPLADLLKRRVDATRDRLVKAEGIPAERLSAVVPAAATAAAGATEEGRVEFGIDAAGE